MNMLDYVFVISQPRLPISASHPSCILHYLRETVYACVANPKKIQEEGGKLENMEPHHLYMYAFFSNPVLPFLGLPDDEESA